MLTNESVKAVVEAMQQIKFEGLMRLMGTLKQQPMFKELSIEVEKRQAIPMWISATERIFPYVQEIFKGHLDVLMLPYNLFESDGKHDRVFLEWPKVVHPLDEMLDKHATNFNNVRHRLVDDFVERECLVMVKEVGHLLLRAALYTLECRISSLKKKFGLLYRDCGVPPHSVMGDQPLQYSPAYYIYAKEFPEAVNYVALYRSKEFKTVLGYESFSIPLWHTYPKQMKQDELGNWVPDKPDNMKFSNIFNY